MPVLKDQRLFRQLTSLAEYRLLGTSQIAHLHFSGLRAARKRMQKLLKERLVEAYNVPDETKSGRREGMFGIGEAGFESLRSCGVMPEEVDFEQVCASNLMREAGHQRLLNWFRVHLAHLGKQVALIDSDILSFNSPFSAHPGCYLPVVAEKESGDWEMTSPVLRPDVLRPDAVVRFTDNKSTRSVLLFLEVDMGTEPKSSERANVGIRDKIIRYKQVFRTGTYKRFEDYWKCHFGGFRLLFLCNSEERCTSLCNLVRHESPADFVWLTSSDRMWENGVSGNIWFPGGRQDQKTDSLLDHMALSAPLPKLTN